MASRSTLLSPGPNKHSRASNQSIALSNISPKANFLPGLHMKTHFNGATALMMQYDKSSLYYEPEELNKQMGRGGGSILDQVSLDERTDSNSVSRHM